MKYTKIDKHGNVTDNKCPACDGECVDFVDFTNARGGQVHFQPCYLCNATGVAKEGKDYDIVSFILGIERKPVTCLKTNVKTFGFLFENCDKKSLVTFLVRSTEGSRYGSESTFPIL